MQPLVVNLAVAHATKQVYTALFSASVNQPVALPGPLPTRDPLYVASPKPFCHWMNPGKVQTTGCSIFLRCPTHAANRLDCGRRLGEHSQATGHPDTTSTNNRDLLSNSIAVSFRESRFGRSRSRDQYLQYSIFLASTPAAITTLSYLQAASKRSFSIQFQIHARCIYLVSKITNRFSEFFLPEFALLV